MKSLFGISMGTVMGWMLSIFLIATAIVLVLALGKVFVVDGIISKSISAGVLPPLAWSDFEGTMPVLILLGIIVSGLASFLTLRRFVRV